MLLHGFGASIGHWRQNLEVLGEHHTVYALDMLGFGASYKAAANYSVELWVEQVYEFWKTFIGEPMVLIGNSLGSLVCLAAASIHPDMVKGVVMMSLPDPAMEQELIPEILQPVVAAIKKLFASPLLIKPILQVLRQPKVLRRVAIFAYANPEAVTDELVDILVGPPQERGSARALIALCKAAANPKYAPSVKSLLPNITTPMLLIWGQNDRVVRPVLARKFAESNPNLQLIILEGAGHCPHDESPEEVNQAILDWMDRCLSLGNKSVAPVVP
jgi:pimeloyl-ACP methyl ester carboxylesterase